MPDTKPLSNSEVDERLRSALDALGKAPGATTIGNGTIIVARSMLSQFIRALMLRTMPTTERWPAWPRKPKSDSRPDPQP